MEDAKLQCPAINDNKEKRIENLKENICVWIYSKALTDLIKAFGGEIPQQSNSYDYITELNNFAEIWDYRKKANTTNERWMVEDDEKVLRLSDIIMESAERLGMLGVEDPAAEPDFILPLGGARMTNYERPLLAKRILDKKIYPSVNIVALTGKRPINEIEKEYLSKYAPEASTEYEAMCGGMEKVFALEDSNYVETNYYTKNINMQWSIRKYDSLYNGHSVTVLAAPSTEPQRRANSYDTFKFFLERFNIKAGDYVLLVTSGIYVPFQLARFLPIAIEKNIFVDCVGLSNAQGGVAFSKAANYCQEIKATINAIKTLADMYWSA